VQEHVPWKQFSGKGDKFRDGMDLIIKGVKNSSRKMMEKGHLYCKNEINYFTFAPALVH
jgi:hypothetical protein